MIKVNLQFIYKNQFKKVKYLKLKVKNKFFEFLIYMFLINKYFIYLKLSLIFYLNY
jgi:hypothetical protein